MASRRQRFKKLMRRQHDQSTHSERLHREVFNGTTGARVSIHRDEVALEGDYVIERQGGPVPHESTHRPKRHPRHEAAILLHDALRQAGVKDAGVSAQMVDKFLQLLEHVGSPDVTVTQLVDQLIKQRDDQVAEGARRLGVVPAFQDSFVNRGAPTVNHDQEGSFTITSPLGTTEEIPYDATMEKIVEAAKPIGGVGAVLAATADVGVPPLYQTECALSGLRLADGSAARHPTEDEWEEVVASARRRKRGLTKHAEAAGYEFVGEYPRQRTSWLIRDEMAGGS